MGTAAVPIPGNRRTTQATSTSTTRQQTPPYTRQQTFEPSVTIVVARGRCTVTGPSLNRINQTLLEMRNGGGGGDPDMPVNVAAGGGTGPGTGGQIRRRAPMSQAARQKLSMAAKLRAQNRRAQQAQEPHSEAGGANKGTRKAKTATATG